MKSFCKYAGILALLSLTSCGREDVVLFFRATIFALAVIIILYIIFMWKYGKEK